MNSQFNELIEKLGSGKITMQEAIKELKLLKLQHTSPALKSEKSTNDIYEIYTHDELFLRDHTVNNEQVLIGSAHISLAINAFFKMYPSEECVRLRKITFIKPITVKSNNQVQVYVESKLLNDIVNSVIKFKDNNSAQWQTTATCQLQKSIFADKQLKIENIKKSLPQFSEIEQIYLNNSLVKFGDSFKIIKELYINSDQALARIKRPIDDHHQYVLHPHVINSAFTVIGPILAKNSIKEAYLPFSIKEMQFHKNYSSEPCWIFINLTKNSNEVIDFDASIMTDEGTIIAEMLGCTIKRVRNVENIQQNNLSNNIGIKIQQYLVSKLSKLFKHHSQAFNLETNLMGAGLESTQLVQLANEIEQEINIELYPTVFFEYPNIKELVNYFIKEHADAFAKINSTFVALDSNKLDMEQNQLSSTMSPSEENYKHSSSLTSNSDAEIDDIAIIGVSAQFAETNSLDDFWKHLINKKDLIKEVPLDHWDYRQWYDPNPEAKDKTYCKWGSFLDDIDKFDAAFFKISPREATWIDPQLRLLLQNIYASAEDAGCINKLRGTNTGVFIGVCSHDYVDRLTELNLPMNPFVGVGTTQTVFANRISFLFNLTGPSIAYDTACSSSLFALHAACQALKNKECDMAFVGGTNLLMSSQHYRYFSSIKALSFTGHCHSFDASADGYVPGECVASVLLKPLKKAKEDGDQIYAVIKGSAALHGGYTPSLTAPSVAGEENVILKAWENAKINPETIGYIEAHGTGTKLGDPIEVNALKNAFRKFTNKQNFCAIGTGKANIGHTEGAAGIAGLIKVILQLKYKSLPVMPNFKSLNPYIKLDGSALYINHENEEWKTSPGQPRRAGISSFGFSGAYAHVIVEEYITDRFLSNHIISPMNMIIPLSAMQSTVLQEQVKRLLIFIREHQLTDADLINIAYTLQIGREAMDERLALVATSIKDLENKLLVLLEHPQKIHYSDIHRGTIQNVNSMPEYSISNEQLEELIQYDNYNELAKLWVKGISIQWNKLYEKNNKLVQTRKISLPTYPFIKQQYGLPHNEEFQNQNIKKFPELAFNTSNDIPANHNKKPDGIMLTSLSDNKPSATSILKNNQESELVLNINQQVSNSTNEYNSTNTININKLQQQLIESLAKALYVQPNDIQLDKNFNDLGLDSIISAEWMQTINKFYGTSHAAKILYEYSTIRKLTDFLSAQVLTNTSKIECEKTKIISMPVSSSNPVARNIREEIVTQLANSFAAALFMKPDEINLDKQFSDMGLDSIISIEWINAINKQYSTNFESKILYDYSTINKFSKLIATTLNDKTSSFNESHPTKEEKFSSDSVPLEDIAIIGLSGHYPKAQNISEFWHNLLEGRDCIEKIPRERWDYAPYLEEKILGKPYCIWGGFLKDIDKFDPLFFNISPREAEIMDPNERLFLETSWNLFESAGYTRQSISQKCHNKVGVFAGVMYQHYHLLDSEEAKEAAVAISSHGGIANRVSHYFDLNGPSLAIDTMCSSSATAIHLACDSLKKGECKMAIAGGINLSLHPKKYMGLSLSKMLSSQVDLRSFAAGDGFIPAEAVGAVLLKPLKNALKDKDTILAVIKSTAISHRGKSDNFAIPNENAQVELINDHFAKSGIDPQTISYVECGASGNSLADSIEVKALTTAFNKYTDHKHFCAIGSVKANIGHAEAASGISQLTKVVLQLHHQKILPAIKSNPLNNEINLDSSPFYLQKQTKQWDRPIINVNGQMQELPRRAALSSFGAGGSNVHMILEEYIPAQQEQTTLVSPIGPQLIIFSARNTNRLRAVVEQILTFIINHPQISLLDLAYTLQIEREEMEVRLAMIVNNREELIETMKLYLEFSSNVKSITNNVSIFSGESGEKLGNSTLSVLYPIENTELHKMAKHWCQGGKVAWEQLYNKDNIKRLMLPTYPFEKRRCWIGVNTRHLPSKNNKTVMFTSNVNNPANQNIPKETEKNVINIFAKVIGINIDELKLNAPLSQYGVDSILMTQVFQQLQSQVDPALDLHKFAQSKTLQEIINNISLPSNSLSIASETVSIDTNVATSVSQTSWPQFPELIRLNTASEGTPVFWFHAGLGGVETYLELAQKSKRPFYGIQARGFMTNRTPLQGVQAMAAYYIHMIQTVQPVGPYDFGGYSFGGGLAYEVTRQLQELGHKIDSIVMCDTHDSTHMKKINTTYRSELLQTVNTMLGAMVAKEPEKILKTMIHRDEININTSDEEFLSQLVTLAKKRGLNKSKKQLQIMTKQNAKVQKAYDIHQFAVLPLPNPKLVNCYYFRNKSGSFWGPLEPYNIFSSTETMVDNTKYWGEWKKNISSFYIIDVDSFSHLTLLSQPHTRDTILSFCEMLYSTQNFSNGWFDLFKKETAALHGVREEITTLIATEM
jgi:acyl transferase domain-containing protein/thioesterase domain-containing protein